jgi:hypothetical protein
MTREEAVNIMSQMIKDEEGFLSDNIVEAHKMAFRALEQEPKTGHWIDNKARTNLCNCSECGALSKAYSKYCPNCGAKMQGMEE